MRSEPRLNDLGIKPFYYNLSSRISFRICLAGAEQTVIFSCHFSVTQKTKTKRMED